MKMGVDRHRWRRRSLWCQEPERRPNLRAAPAPLTIANRARRESGYSETASERRLDVARARAGVFLEKRIPRCAGIDLGEADSVVWVWVPDVLTGAPTELMASYGTITPASI